MIRFKLNAKNRKWLLPAVALIILYISYQFSFSLAFSAWWLNRTLSHETERHQDDAAYPHLNQKHLFYQKTLADYKVRTGTMDTETWQVLSGMAVANNLRITYVPNKLTADTSSSQKVLSQQYQFKGSYFSVVKLLDTLTKTQRVGKISGVSIGLPKQTSEDKNDRLLEMILTLKAIEK